MLLRSHTRDENQKAASDRTELLASRFYDTAHHALHRRNKSSGYQVVKGDQCIDEGGGDNITRVVRRQLLKALYKGRDPFLATGLGRFRPDHKYPHSNLLAGFVRAALLSLGNVSFWLEVGSFVGTSLVLTSAVAADLCYSRMSMVAVDPFLGDVNMWAYQRGMGTSYDFLKLDETGRPSIYQRFMANVLQAGAAPMTVPMTMPSLVGLRLLYKLHSEGHLPFRPQAIYLDASHEAGETLLELRAAWRLLAPGGLLMGDDWGWSGVRHDVLAFAQQQPAMNDLASRHADAFSTHAASGGLNCTRVVAARLRPGAKPIFFILLCLPSTTWVLFKG